MSNLTRIYGNLKCIKIDSNNPKIQIHISRIHINKVMIYIKIIFLDKIKTFPFNTVDACNKRHEHTLPDECVYRNVKRIPASSRTQMTPSFPVTFQLPLGGSVLGVGVGLMVVIGRLVVVFTGVVVVVFTGVVVVVFTGVVVVVLTGVVVVVLTGVVVVVLTAVVVVIFVVVGVVAVVVVVPTPAPTSAENGT